VPARARGLSAFNREIDVQHRALGRLDTTDSSMTGPGLITRSPIRP